MRNNLDILEKVNARSASRLEQSEFDVPGSRLQCHWILVLASLCWNLVPPGLFAELSGSFTCQLRCYEGASVSSSQTPNLSLSWARIAQYWPWFSFGRPLSVKRPSACNKDFFAVLNSTSKTISVHDHMTNKWVWKWFNWRWTSWFSGACKVQSSRRDLFWDSPSCWVSQLKSRPNMAKRILDCVACRSLHKSWRWPCADNRSGSCASFCLRRWRTAMGRWNNVW